MHKSEFIHAAIVGARGYSGLELARLLLKHPSVKLSACFAGERAFALSDFLPEGAASSVPVRELSELKASLSDLDVVFLATPAEASAELAPQILEAGADVIDLSGAFRLPGETADSCRAIYRDWYRMEHPRPDLVSSAHYGLSPWAQKGTTSRSATLISNPGCYATAILMGLIPLLKDGLIDPASLVIDAKSGTSGAGRKAAENLLFNEVDGECLPYRVGKHQHLPEIREYASRFGGQAIEPHFTTSLLPVRRGIIAGIYANLSPGVGAAEVEKTFARAYANYPLIRFSALSDLTPAAQAQVLSLKRVQGTARTHLSFEIVGGKLYLFSLIDNLLKGAAAQAVENLNWLNDLAVGTGLTAMEGIL